jgi:hypothetical protein
MTDVMRRTGNRVIWWCPGCEDAHQVPVVEYGEPSGWSLISADMHAPTLIPSVLVHSPRRFANTDLQEPALTNEANIRPAVDCHSFVRDGVIDFLGDCTHQYAGVKVPMVSLPPHLQGE